MRDVDRVSFMEGADLGPRWRRGQQAHPNPPNRESAPKREDIDKRGDYDGAEKAGPDMWCIPSRLFVN